MLSFKQFLTEYGGLVTSERTTRLDPEKAVSLVEERCNEYATKMRDPAFGIYRGGSGRSNWEAVLGDSLVGAPRKSANTENYFTLWHDGNPAWADFPKRARSFICSSDTFTAAGYGTVRLLVPFDGAKIGVLPEDDLFESFPTIGDLASFNDAVTETFKALLIKYPTTYEELVKALGEVTLEKLKAVKEHLHPYVFVKLTPLLKHGTLLDGYKQVFVPGADFKHYTTATAKPFPHDREVYVQGRAVLLDLHALEKKDGPFQALIDRYSWFV